MHAARINKNRVAGRRLQSATRIGSAALLCMVLGACNGDNMDDLQNFIKETKTKFNGQVEPLPEVRPYESYRYKVANLRDPFRNVTPTVKSIGHPGAGNGVRPNMNRNKEELERFPLDSLKMVGILENNGETWAAVKAPDKTIYRVRKGNYIGMNNGKIKRISETKIEVVEIIADGTGGWVERPNTLALTE